MPVASTAAATGADEDGKNIWIAAGEGDLERVRHLVDVEGVSPVAADQWTYTPVHAAVSYGHLDVLRFLLRHPSAPADAVETTDSDGDTPLFVAETVEVARTLVEEFKANAKHENQAGNTAAATAEENENDDVAAYLRSVTGEEPMYQTLSDLQRQEEQEGVAAEGASSTLTDEAIDERTDALMLRVQDILHRAEARGATSGEQLSEREEAELRQVVGESVLTQIREGWGAGQATETVESIPEEPSTVERQNVDETDIDSVNDRANGQDNHDADTEEELSRPGR